MSQQDWQLDLIASEQAARLRAEELRERASFLAEAGKILSSSLDYETTLVSVARLAVPRIADWCAVHIVGEDGVVRQLATEHMDPTRVELARELDRRYPHDPYGPGGLPSVLRTGQSEIVAEITDEMIAALVTDPELLRILLDLGLRSAMVVPLIARGQILGGITLVAAESNRLFDDGDLSLAQDLASRAALAVDNARLYRRAQQVAAERQAILTQMADGVTIADPTGRITFINEAAHQMTGLGAKVGQSAEEYVHVAQLLDADGNPLVAEDIPVMRALRGEVVSNAVWQLHRPDGEEVVVEGTAVPIYADDGTLLGAVSTFHDVTQQRDIDRQKEEFLSAAAHDLKTPLTTIKGTAQMLQRRVQRLDFAEAHRIMEGLAQIDAGVTRMARLVDHLLDTTMTQMGRPLDLILRPTELVSMIQSLVDEFRQGADHHEFTVRAPARGVDGLWDANRLERVFSNLLSNALKFSPEGGEIVVSISTERQADGEWALVTVRDRGVGIPATDISRVFERFYRSKKVETDIAGTGIGLAGARQIVEQHGGTIEIESTEGEGTTVSVRLPLVTSHQPVEERSMQAEHV